MYNKVEKRKTSYTVEYQLNLWKKENQSDWKLAAQRAVVSMCIHNIEFLLLLMKEKTWPIRSKLDQSDRVANLCSYKNSEGESLNFLYRKCSYNFGILFWWGRNEPSRSTTSAKCSNEPKWGRVHSLRV